MRSILFIVSGVVVGAVGTWYYASTLPIPEHPHPPSKVNLTLPLDPSTANVSRCFESKGAHLTRPEDIDPTKPSAGPTYLQWQPTGEVTAIEYHFAEEALKTGDLKAHGHLGKTPFDLKGANYDHFTLTYQPTGHSGYEIPHFDVHVFTKTQAERDTLKCPAAP